jgi:hypothetical protein
LRALLRRRHAALPDLSPVSSPINDDAAPAPPSGSLAPGAAVAQWVALWQIVFFIQRVLSHYRAIGYTPYFFSGGHPTELSGIGGWYRQAQPRKAAKLYYRKKLRPAASFTIWAPIVVSGVSTRLNKFRYQVSAKIR